MSNQFCMFIDNKKCDYKKDEKEITLACIFCVLELIEKHLYSIKKYVEKSNSNGNSKRRSR